MTTEPIIPDIHTRIQARRDALAAQLESAKAQYDELERTLVLLQRNMDAMHGGLQELEALLKEVSDESNR